MRPAAKPVENPPQPQSEPLLPEPLLPEIVDEKNEQAKNSQAGDLLELIIKDVKYRFRWCPAGKFTMGSSSAP